MTTRHAPEVCGVCARPAIGFGYVPPTGYNRKPIIWCCDDPECLKIAKDSYNMKQNEFTRLDTMAALDGGNAGGEYLDKIGKTDLGELTEAEWSAFCMALVGGYREALQGRLKNESPF